MKVCAAGPSSTIKLGWAKLMKPFTDPVPWLCPTFQRRAPKSNVSTQRRKQRSHAERERKAPVKHSCCGSRHFFMPCSEAREGVASCRTIHAWYRTCCKYMTRPCLPANVRAMFFCTLFLLRALLYCFRELVYSTRGCKFKTTHMLEYEILPLFLLVWSAQRSFALLLTCFPRNDSN